MTGLLSSSFLAVMALEAMCSWTHRTMCSLRTQGASLWTHDTSCGISSTRTAPRTYQVVNRCLLNKSAPTRKLGKWSIFLLKICRIDLNPCTILICWGCHNKIPLTGWLKEQTFFPHSFGVWEVHYQGALLAGLIPAESPPAGSQVPALLLYPHMAEKEIMLVVSLLIRALITFVRAPPMT